MNSRELLDWTNLLIMVIDKIIAYSMPFVKVKKPCFNGREYWLLAVLKTLYNDMVTFQAAEFLHCIVAF